jgi:hypothetical protein
MAKVPPEEAISHEEAAAYLSVDLLLWVPNIHTYLSENLRGLKVGATAEARYTSTSSLTSNRY